MRKRVIYRGRVQGVGFRATVHSIASRHTVVGFVRNLRDGSVELVADGPDEDVEAFLAAVADHFGGYITRVETGPAEAGEAFRGFMIRR